MQHIFSSITLVIDPKLMLACLLGVTFMCFSFFLVGLSNIGLASGVRLSVPLPAKCTAAVAKPSLA